MSRPTAKRCLALFAVSLLPLTLLAALVCVVGPKVAAVSLAVVVALISWAAFVAWGVCELGPGLEPGSSTRRTEKHVETTQGGRDDE